jgi:NADPH-dependent 2,4-dienoyl-CoA reductase/sulfur reductase-like enzyme
MARRYRRADRAERSRLLDEFVAVTGLHRKYAIELLGRKRAKAVRRRGRPSRFGPEVVNALLGLRRAMVSVVAALAGYAALMVADVARGLSH